MKLPIVLFLASIAGAQPKISSVVNAATLAPGIAPGSLFTIFGTGLSSGITSASFAWPIQLGGSSVTVCSSAMQCAQAGLLYASPTQINAYLPASLSAGPVNVNVASNQGTSAAFSLTIEQVAQAIFTEGTDSPIQQLVEDPFLECPFGSPARPVPYTVTRAALTDLSGTLVSSKNPARVGQYYTMWLTGMAIGTTTAAPYVGYTASSAVMQMAISFPPYPLGCFVDYHPSAIAKSPQYPGLDQINFQVPAFLFGSSGDSYYPLFQCGTYRVEVSINVQTTALDQYGYFAGYPQSNIIQLPILVLPGDVPCTK